MSKRSINEILDAPFSGDGDSHSNDYHATLVALREARALMISVMSETERRRLMDALLKKWDEYG